MRLAYVFATLLAAPATAQTPVDGPEFDALVTGQTVTYVAQDGLSIGIEAYHPNGRVTWLVSDGICQKGQWFAQGGQICFEYQNENIIHCTDVTQSDGTLHIVHTSGGTWTSTEIHNRPINCSMDFLGS